MFSQNQKALCFLVGLYYQLKVTWNLSSSFYANLVYRMPTRSPNLWPRLLPWRVSIILVYLFIFFHIIFFMFHCLLLNVVYQRATIVFISLNKQLNLVSFSPFIFFVLLNCLLIPYLLCYVMTPFLDTSINVLFHFVHSTF